MNLDFYWRFTALFEAFIYLGYRTQVHSRKDPDMSQRPQSGPLYEQKKSIFVVRRIRCCLVVGERPYTRCEKKLLVKRKNRTA